MFDYELTSRASMESETQRIALGLRQGDVVVLRLWSSNTNTGLFVISSPCWADAMELTISCRRRGSESWSGVGRTTGNPALNPGSSGWHAILLSMPCVSDRCSVWTQMRRMVFAHRLLPVSLRHTRLRRGHKMPSGLPTPCKLWSPSIAKPSYCAFKKIYLYRRYLWLWE